MFMPWKDLVVIWSGIARYIVGHRQDTGIRDLAVLEQSDGRINTNPV
jgi:hypothetical protein